MGELGARANSAILRFSCRVIYSMRYTNIIMLIKVDPKKKEILDTVVRKEFDSKKIF